MNTTEYTPRPSLIKLQTQAQWMGFLILASGLHVFEAALPSLGPWFKFGIANIVTLIVLVRLGITAAISLAIGRVIIGSFFIGTMFTPTFFISFSATLVATTMMIASWVLIPRISLVGVSLIGALAHMCAQFFVVEQLFIQQHALYYLLPPLLVLSCATGWLNGVLATYITAQLHSRSK